MKSRAVLDRRTSHERVDAVEAVGRRGNDRLGCERKVAAIVQVVLRRQREQRVELARPYEAGQVEMEPAEVTEHVDPGSKQARECVHAVGNQRQRRASVWNDQLQVGMAGDCAIEHEVHDGAGGVEEELEHGAGPPERCLLPARRRRRMQEDTCAATVELTKDRFERRITDVGATDVGQQHEPIDIEMFTAVHDLGDGRIDVRQRERGQQPEPSGVVDHGATTVLVHFACEVDVGRAFAEVHTR